LEIDANRTHVPLISKAAKHPHRCNERGFLEVEYQQVTVLSYGIHSITRSSFEGILGWSKEITVRKATQSGTKKKPILCVSSYTSWIIIFRNSPISSGYPMPLTPTTYIYKTVNDCQIKADVYRAPGKDSGGPAVVHIHGGCLMYGSRQGIRPKQVELYLQAGYTVVSIDYRLAPETQLPEIIEDLQDAFGWIRDSGPGLFAIDPHRIAVVGHSAGGYLALMAGCCVQPRPRAIVSFYGYGDIVGDWYSKPDPFYNQQPRVSQEESGRWLAGPVISEPYAGRGKEKLYLWCRQNGLWPQVVGGRNPAEDPSFFAQYCPLRNVDGAYPPTLLLHGDLDTDVPYEQSVLMADELSRQGVEHQLIPMTGLGHGFDRDMDNPEVAAAFARVLAFLHMHTAIVGS
jgi:acetyl esterase/lipase